MLKCYVVYLKLILCVNYTSPEGGGGVAAKTVSKDLEENKHDSHGSQSG